MLSELKWILLPALIAVLGLGLLLRALVHYGKGRPGRGTMHTLAGVPLAIAGLAVALVGFNTQTFARLTHEGPVADVWIAMTDPAKRVYRVRVTRLDGSKLSQDCLLQGAEWD